MPDIDIKTMVASIGVMLTAVGVIYKLVKPTSKKEEAETEIIKLQAAAIKRSISEDSFNKIREGHEGLIKIGQDMVEVQNGVIEGLRKELNQMKKELKEMRKHQAKLEEENKTLRSDIAKLQNNNES